MSVGDIEMAALKVSSILGPSSTTFLSGLSTLVGDLSLDGLLACSCLSVGNGD